MPEEIYEPFDADEDDDIYMSASESKSIRGFVEALNIFSRYLDKGLDETFFSGAEHDVLYLYVDPEDLHPNSSDGKRLRALGFHPDTDVESWAYFT